MNSLLNHLATCAARGTSNINTQRLLRVVGLLTIFIVLADLLLTIRIYTPRARIPPLTPAANTPPSLSWNATLVPFTGSEPPQEPAKEKVYLASIHWNDAELLSAHWVPAVLDFISRYGKDNVFVSVVESGSWDETKNILKRFDARLEEMGVGRSVVLDERTHADLVKLPPELGNGVQWKGWVRGRGGEWERRRIPYLGEVRNRALGPLREMVRGDKEGFRMFEKVVWLNDVIFTADQLLTLLKTRNGSYSAVCALDFSVPTKLYDSFATRDSLGLPPLILSWPFFSSPSSRVSIIAYEPTPVRSCWNGLVVFASAPFYQGLEFRGVEDSLAGLHVEGSECCLVHSDAETYWAGGGKGVWINPNVRVAYNEGAMEGVNGEGGWPNGVGKVTGVWAMSWQWLVGGLGRWRERSVVEARVRKWMVEGREVNGTARVEEGVWCLKDEMHVLVDNGWAHI